MNIHCCTEKKTVFSNRFFSQRIFENDGRKMPGIDTDIGTMIDGRCHRLEMAFWQCGQREIFAVGR